jgi:hypothetical protein
MSEKFGLGADDRVGLVCDHRAHQLHFIFEVVVELRRAHLGRIADQLGCRAGHSALVNKLGGCFDDALPRRKAFGSEGPFVGGQSPHCLVIPFWS